MNLDVDSDFYFSVVGCDEVSKSLQEPFSQENVHYPG